MRYLAKGGFWVGFAQTFNGILSLVLVVAFANLLPKETYGLYRYILSIAAMLNIFTLSGMNNAVSRAVAKGDEGVLRPAVMYQLKWNLLMLVATWTLGGYYLFKDDLTLALSFFILGTFVPCTLAFNTYGSYLDGKKQFKMAYSLSVLATFTYSVGMLITLFVTDAVVWMVAIYAVTTFVPSILFYLYTLYKFKPPAGGDVIDTLKYGRELTYLRFIEPIVSQIDKIILAHFWGSAQLATYALALAVPNRAALFMKSWVAIGFPKFAEKTFTEINQVFWRRIVQGLLLGSVATIGYMLVSPYLFKYLLPQYIDGVLYSQLLSFNFITAIPNRYISLLFTSQRLSLVLFNRAIVISVITVIMYLVFGIWGGLLGLVLSNVLLSLISLILNVTLWLKISRHGDQKLTTDDRVL